MTLLHSHFHKRCIRRVVVCCCLCCLCCRCYCCYCCCIFTTLLPYISLFSSLLLFPQGFLFSLLFFISLLWLGRKRVIPRCMRHCHFTLRFVVSLFHRTVWFIWTASLQTLCIASTFISLWFCRYIFLASTAGGGVFPSITCVCLCVCMCCVAF